MILAPSRSHDPGGVVTGPGGWLVIANRGSAENILRPSVTWMPRLATDVAGQPAQSAFIRLSKATHSILVQNIMIALGIKAVFLTLTFVDYGAMWMAVFADVGGSLLVVDNGLRVLRKRPDATYQ